MAPRVCTYTFLVALLVDLASKAYAVDHFQDVVYNGKPGQLVRRLAMSVVAVSAVVALTRLASWRGIGRIWGAWVGVGLLVAGIVGNGASRLIWSRGVPDFITMGREVWNIADFEIGVGLTGGLVSIAVAALFAFTRERLQLDLR